MRAGALLLLSASVLCAPQPRISLELNRNDFAKNNLALVENVSPNHADLVQLKGWAVDSKADPNSLLELVVAVRQQSKDRLQSILLDISDPRSPRYGQWLTQTQVHDLTRPAAKSVEAVVNWLKQYNVTQLTHSLNSDFITAVVPVSTAEALLGPEAQYYVYRHSTSSRTVTRLHMNSRYLVPASVAEAIDFIAPTHTFPLLRPTKRTTGQGNAAVTPTFLRGLYNVTDNGSVNSSNVQGIASFIGQHYLLNDLQTFWKAYDVPAVPFTNIPDPQPHDAGIEASLDVQYITALGQNISTQHWYTDGEQPHNPGNEPFVKWLQAVSAALSPPLLFSVSYGDEENGVSPDYAQRCAVEFQKIGARGISLLFASGDSGAGCSLTAMVPTFPASCPYVTAVGGTTGGKVSKSPTQETTASLSGGGFSNYFGIPDFQVDALAKYKKQSSLPAQKWWNNTGAGFPDIAAQALDFEICTDGAFGPVSGTSAACPTAAGIVALLNQIRVDAGKPSLGFLNPLLYQVADLDGLALNDITTGSNMFCGRADGFPATPGWDAATGWGTLNYGRLKLLVEQLP